MLEDKQVRDIYELHHERGTSDAVDEAFTEVQDIAKRYGLTVANDDRAERLVTAIARYILESGNDYFGILRVKETT